MVDDGRKQRTRKSGRFDENFRTKNDFFFQSWIDTNLIWKPADWDNVTQLHIKYDRVWLPDIVLYNVEKQFSLLFDSRKVSFRCFSFQNADNLASLSQISTNVMVSFDGTVTWLSTGIFRSSCSIDVRFFPFGSAKRKIFAFQRSIVVLDEQNCSLKFASWTYDSARIDLFAKTAIGDLSNFIANSEWEIIGLHIKKNYVKYSCCKFSMIGRVLVY